MKSKHTPGPWEYAENSANNFDVFGAGDTVEVAVVWGLDDPLKAEREANARLIAAAPELLEALEDSLDLFGVFLDHSDKGNTDMHRALGVKIRAAIAKAKGE